MKVQKAMVPFLMLLVSVGIAYAADDSFADQFLGSPLLILAALIVIVILVFIYRKIVK
jgi:hypothetical protein